MDFLLEGVRKGQLVLVDVGTIRLFPEFINITKTVYNPKDFTPESKTFTVRNMASPSTYHNFGNLANGYQMNVHPAGEYRDLIDVPREYPLLYLGSFVGSRDAYEAHYGVMAKPIICHRFLYDEKVYIWAGQRLENGIKKYTTEQWAKIFKESGTLFRQFFKLI
jgi:hypothetical protein